MSGWSRAPAVIAVTVGLAGGLAWLGGGGLLLTLAVVAVVIQWVAYVPAYALRTEHFYDLTGSMTYVTLVVIGLSQAEEVTLRAAWLSAATLVWAVRLGAFLAWRVHQAGSDGRFDELKQSAPRFLVAWTLQGLWCFVTPLAVWICLCSPGPGIGPLDGLGFALWLVGFVVEVSSDLQKSAFKSDPANAGRFISTGWWAWSRHPNYAGEILLWCGVFLSASSQLRGSEWVALLAPAFVYLLLRHGSGVPLLEARADERWGADEDYLAYRARTPVLWPRPPR